MSSVPSTPRSVSQVSFSASGELTAEGGEWMDVRFEPDLLDAYRSHARMFESSVTRIHRALKTRDTPTIRSEWEDAATVWLSTSQPYTALSRDILDHHFPRTTRKRYGLTLDLRPPLTG